MKPRFYTLVGMILAAAALRLVPHPFNFAPVAAIALFGGAHFSNKRQAFLIPLAAMFLSDLLLGGFHATLPYVYLSFAAIVCIGLFLRRRLSPLPIAGATVASSFLFFIVTNFGVWASQSLYPKTAAGLIACYTAAIPFFQQTLAGDAVYATALFGGFALAERWIPVLRESSWAPAT